MNILAAELNRPGVLPDEITKMKFLDEVLLSILASGLIELRIWGLIAIWSLNVSVLRDHSNGGVQISLFKSFERSVQDFCQPPHVLSTCTFSLTHSVVNKFECSTFCNAGYYIGYRFTKWCQISSRVNPSTLVVLGCPSINRVNRWLDEETILPYDS